MTRLIILLIIAGAVWAQDERPSWEEIRKVSNYLSSGPDAILYDTRVTTGIVREGENRNQPENTITEIAKDSVGYVWMNFLLPPNVEEKRYTLLIKKGPLPKLTSQIKLGPVKNGQIVYRTWRKFTFTDVGEYVVEVYFKENLVTTLKVECKEM